MEKDIPSGGGGGRTPGFSVDPLAVHEMASWLLIYRETLAAQRDYAREHFSCPEAFPFFSTDLLESYETTAGNEIDLLDEMTRRMDGAATALRRTADSYERMEGGAAERMRDIDRVLGAPSAPSTMPMFGSENG